MKRLLACSLLLLTAAPAAAQSNIPESAYRGGQPEVLKPEPDPNEGPVFDPAAFRAAYTKANRPTVAVLWNRQFSDMLEQASATTLNINRVQAGVVQREVAVVPGFAAGQAVGASAANTTIDVQERRTQQAQRRGPVERVDLQMRGSFMQTISTAGVRVIDRNLVMRTTASDRRDKDKDEKLDAQMIETKALSKHAKLLMEVLNTPDPGSPTGWATFVSVKSLADGVVVMEGYFKGRYQKNAPRATPQFEPDPRGGFREVGPKVQDVGRIVAEQMLAQLGEALAR
jgi:hypothetical protein